MRRVCLGVLFLVLLLFSYVLPTTSAQQAAAASPSTEEQEADQLSQQVSALFRTKSFQKALPLASRAVQLREKALGAEHAKTLLARRNLAAVYSELGKAGEAANLYQQILKVQEKLEGPNNPKLGETLNQFGWARAKEGNLSGAEGLFKRQLQILEAAYGPEHADLQAPLSALAIVSGQLGRHSLALAYYQRIIQLKQKQVGDQHVDLGEFYVRCAVLLQTMGKKSEAAEYDNRARTLYFALAKQDEPTNVSPQILAGYALAKVRPAPPGAGKRGVVKILVKIDEIGVVTEAKPIEGPAELYHVSVEAARQWRFKPALFNGIPRKVNGIITFNFN